MAAPYQRGNIGAGISALFGTADTDLFQVIPYFWQAREQNMLKQRWGRGQNGELSFRHMRAGGKVTIRGDIPGELPPEASSWIGQKKNLVITFDQTPDKTITFSVVVETFDIDGVQKDSNLYGFTATCELTAKATYSDGWGEAVDGGTVTKSDVELYEGAITLDPATVPLQSSAKVIIDWWTLSADTDAAVIARLTAIIAAATPPLGKKRPSIINQDAPDGGTVTLTYGLTDTNDDVVLPRRTTSIDQSTHPTESTANSAALNGTPPTPTGDDFVKRRSATVKLNDGATQSDDEYGPRSIEQDKTFPESPKFDDVSDLGDTEQDSVIDSTHSPADAPSGLKYIGTRRVQQTDSGFYQWTDYFALRTPAEQIEFEGSPDDIDNSSIADAYSTTHHESSNTPSPADPADGFVYLGSLILQVNPADTVEKWRHRDNYARIGNKEKIEFEGMALARSAIQIGDVSHLRIVVQDDDSDGNAPDPADFNITGKVINSSSKALTTSQGAYVGFWIHDYVIAPNDRYDEIVNKGIYKIDPAGFGDQQTVYDTADTSTFPDVPTPTNTDLKLVGRERNRIQVSPEKWEFLWTFGRMTETDRRQLKRRTVDPDGFGLTENIPLVASSRTSSPGTPSQIGATTNLFDTVIEDLVVANGSFTGLYLWTFIFQPTTRKQEAEQQGGFSTDPVALDDEDTQYKTSTSSTAPSAPSARISGQVLRITRARRLQDTPEKWEFAYVFSYRTSADELDAQQKFTEVDASTIPTTSTARTGKTWLVSGGAPSTPTLSGFVIERYRDVELKNPLYRQRQYSWGLSTPQDKQERDRTQGEDDPFEGDEETTGAIVSSASALATYIQANNAATDNKYGGLSVHAHPDALGKYIVETHSINKDIWYEFNYYTKLEDVTSAGGSFVYVAEQYQRGTGLFHCRVAPKTVRRVRGWLRIHRRIYLSTGSYSDSTHGLSALWGLRNDATLLGVPAGQLLFLGASGKEDYKRHSAGHVIVVTYDLERDSMVFQDQAPEGWYTSTTSATVDALNAASNFGIVLTNPSTGTLTPLIT